MDVPGKQVLSSGLKVPPHSLLSKLQLVLVWGISNEIFYTLATQGAAKLHEAKVGSSKKIGCLGTNEPSIPSRLGFKGGLGTYLWSVAGLLSYVILAQSNPTDIVLI